MKRDIVNIVKSNMWEGLKNSSFFIDFYKIIFKRGDFRK